MWQHTSRIYELREMAGAWCIEFRCSHRPLQLTKLWTIFKCRLSNFIWCSFLEALGFKESGEMSIWLIRRPSHPLGLGNSEEKNFILIKLYQIPKHGDSYVLLYNIFLSGTRTWLIFSPGSTDIKEFGNVWGFFSVLISRTPNRKLYLTFPVALTMIFAFSFVVSLYKSLHICLSKSEWTFQTSRQTLGFILTKVKWPHWEQVNRKLIYLSQKLLSVTKRNGPSNIYKAWKGILMC